MAILLFDGNFERFLRYVNFLMVILKNYKSCYLYDRANLLNSQHTQRMINADGGFKAIVSRKAKRADLGSLQGNEGESRCTN